MKIVQDQKLNKPLSSLLMYNISVRPKDISVGLIISVGLNISVGLTISVRLKISEELKNISLRLKEIVWLRSQKEKSHLKKSGMELSTDNSLPEQKKKTSNPLMRNVYPDADEDPNEDKRRTIHRRGTRQSIPVDPA